MFLHSKIIIFLIVFCSTLIPIESIANNFSKDNNKRIISLNSLGADIVSKLDNNSLVGIPGSSLLKKDDTFSNKEIVSEGRMPPSLEKIIKLSPSLVIGSEGFHDKILDKLSELDIKTLRTNTKSIKQLEILISDLSNYLKKDPSKLNSNIKNCYPNKSKSKGTLYRLK